MYLKSSRDTCFSIIQFMGQFLLKYQYGFRKGFSIQNFLLAMIEKWKCAVDTEKPFWCVINRSVYGILLSFLRASACKTSCLCKQYCCLKTHSKLFYKQAPENKDKYVT